MACFKETRKNQRKELMAHIEESIVSLREMKIDDLCNFMLKIIAVVAPNTNVYMGMLYACTCKSDISRVFEARRKARRL